MGFSGKMISKKISLRIGILNIPMSIIVDTIEAPTSIIMNDLIFDLTIIFPPYWFCTEKLTTRLFRIQLLPLFTSPRLSIIRIYHPEINT